MGAAGLHGRGPRDARRAGTRGGALLTVAAADRPVLAIALGIAGLIWGFIADRIGARWPAHDDGSVRQIDWRTGLVMVIGAVALWALPSRFADVGPLVLFGAWFAVLQLLLATDLDQRLLPDVITLPMIPIAFVIAALGWDPLVRDQLLLAVVGAIVVPAFLFVLSIPFGAGAIGIGDIKLLVSVGLLTGLSRAVLGVITGALLAGVVVIGLLVGRRVTLKSYIPFGPFLIVGAYWSVLLTTA